MKSTACLDLNRKGSKLDLKKGLFELDHRGAGIPREVLLSRLCRESNGQSPFSKSDGGGQAGRQAGTPPPSAARAAHAPGQGRSVGESSYRMGRHVPELTLG